VSLGKGRGKQPSKCCGPECAEAAKPEWWNDEELKALSARLVSEGGAERFANQQHAGYRAEPAV
tara:strand:- start:195 stop:386 length:192 start_codon:yes stop_codon:yes gene_type:complete